jgi:DedD protein
MGLISKLKPRSSSPEAEPSLAADLERVQEARRLARRRLIGAALLLLLGIIGFPLLFESQPRPIPVDIPITIPARDALPPLVSPNARGSRADPALQPPPVEAPLSEAGSAPLVPVASEPLPAKQVKAEALPVSPPPSPAAASAAAKAPAKEVLHKTEANLPAPKIAEPKLAAPKLAEPKVAEPKPVVPKPAVAKAAEPKPVESRPGVPEKPTAGGVDELRFVVQVGAYTDAAGVRDARSKVEAMGFKTYTQVVESSTGRRIRVRVGPFGSKSEADAAAAKIKASGLPMAVLQL